MKVFLAPVCGLLLPNMLIRIVKMEFSASGITPFLTLFEERKNTIGSFEGCTHLALLRDRNDPAIFFTFSHWESEYHLDLYRKSAFFKETWALTKIHFSGKAEAWSLEEVAF